MLPGPLMIDLAGMQLDSEESEVLRHPLVGGVILFSRNFRDQDQLLELTSSILRQRPELLIAVDQEGGRVQRFKQGFTPLPPLRSFGRLYDQDKKYACQVAKDSAWLMASELGVMKIDLSFAPVLDLDSGQSEVIGDRAFHSQVDVITELAKVYIEGMHEAGMASCGKHFPGHGSVVADSHLELPFDQRTWSEIDSTDLIPFKELVGSGLMSVMVAHVLYPQVDPEPAGYSYHWIHNILRTYLGFGGVVFSDDLSMVAAEQAGNYSERAYKALHSGCDMVLICNNTDGRNQVLDDYSGEIDVTSQRRLLDLKNKISVNNEELKRLDRWKKVRDQMLAMVNESFPA